MTLQMKRCPKCNKLQMAGRLHTCAVVLRDRKDDARKADEPRKQDLHSADDEPLDAATAIAVDAIAFALDLVTPADSTLDHVADSMEPPTASDPAPAPAFDGGDGGGFGGGGASGSWDDSSASSSTDSGSYDSGGGGGD